MYVSYAYEFVEFDQIICSNDFIKAFYSKIVKCEMDKLIGSCFVSQVIVISRSKEFPLEKVASPVLPDLELSRGFGDVLRVIETYDLPMHDT